MNRKIDSDLFLQIDSVTDNPLLRYPPSYNFTLDLALATDTILLAASTLSSKTILFHGLHLPIPPQTIPPPLLHGNQGWGLLLETLQQLPPMYRYTCLCYQLFI